MNEKLLIIEDDADLREGLVFSFRAEGFAVFGAATAREGLAALERESWSAVILDCNLPDGNGFALCPQIKARAAVPILMLTARDTEMDEVQALSTGADDFMSKPFSLAVLKARVRNMLSRQQAPALLRSADIVVDLTRAQVTRGGVEVALTPVEYQLLRYLMENKNRVLSKAQILAQVWDGQGRYVDENTVAVNIKRLRAKIEDDAKHPVHICTVHGLGYVWKEEV